MAQQFIPGFLQKTFVEWTNKWMNGWMNEGRDEWMKFWGQITAPISPTGENNLISSLGSFTFLWWICISKTEEPTWTWDANDSTSEDPGPCHPTSAHGQHAARFQEEKGELWPWCECHTVFSTKFLPTIFHNETSCDEQILRWRAGRVCKHLLIQSYKQSRLEVDKANGSTLRFLSHWEDGSYVHVCSWFENKALSEP